jgi:hypothetical protein
VSRLRALTVLGACALLIAGAVLVTRGGSESADVEVPEYRDAIARHLDRLAREPRPVDRSALPPRHMDAEAFPTALVPRDRIVSGGPPPDGIPSIDDPDFESVAEVDWIGDREPVLVLDLDGHTKVYPLQVLMWHEIVNDEISGRPVTVTYCPLCNTGIAYDRTVDARVLDFGVSGSLYQSAMVMYDRQTESLWSHFTAQAIVGALTGTRLDVVPVATVAWSDFRAAHPDGLVLSRDTGFDRNYGRNPYVGYDDPDDFPFLFEGEVDGRLAVKERVVGIRDDEQGIAVRLAELERAKVMEVALGDRHLVVWVKPGTASSLDAASVAGGRDVGATGVFSRELDGRLLSFEVDGHGLRDRETFRDRETGSSWDVLGKAVDGPLAGSSLEGYPHVDTFWFAWIAFLPDTEVVPPLSTGRSG